MEDARPELPEVRDDGHTITRGFSITAKPDDITVATTDAEVLDCVALMLMAMKEPVKP